MKYVFGILTVIVLVLILVGCTPINEELGLPNDNPLEQTAEFVLDAVIQKETGVDPQIDLTPSDVQ